MTTKVWSIVAVFAVLALSGCIGGEETPDALGTDADEALCEGGFCGQGALLDEVGRDLRFDLTADDKLDAPEWEVGDVFEQHVYYGAADTAGEHIQTMIVDDSGSCYQIATSSQNAANYEVTFDLPFLGCIGKDSLDTSGFRDSWEWMYDFPLEHGKVWNGRLDFLYNWNTNSILAYDFKLEALYNEAINTPKGDFPGFEIIGTTPDGDELMRYNYVPAVGWFSHFWLYDLTTPDAGDVILHMMSMGTSDRYTGEYFLNDGQRVLEHFSFLGGAPIFPDNSPPVISFDAADNHDLIKGIIVPIACPGAAAVVLTTPSNEVQRYEHTYDGDMEACLLQGSGPEEDEDSEINGDLFTVHWIEQTAEAGTYHLAGLGTGFGGYYVEMTVIDELKFTLTLADLSRTAAEDVATSP